MSEDINMLKWDQPPAPFRDFTPETIYIEGVVYRNEDKRRCGNCAFWGRHPDDPEMVDEWPDEFRWCTAVIHGNDDEIPRDEDHNRILVPYKAIVTDGSGYSATLRTKEDFGCRLFKEFEGEKTE